MILKRSPISKVIHEQTGITLQVYLVDCFCESYLALGYSEAPEYLHQTRYYETETGQRVVQQRDPVTGVIAWAIETSDGQGQYVRRI